MRSGHATGSARKNRPATVSKTATRAAAAGGQALVDRALDYLAQHYLEYGLSLVAVSEVLGVNDSYLAHIFTTIVGQRMHAYVLQLRIQHACRLLLQTDDPIKQVGHESGFGRADVFRRTFRQHMGVTPGVYRQAFVRA
jgi:two-component system response regulator YesN